MRKPFLTLNFWPILLVAFLLGLIFSGLASNAKAENQLPKKPAKTYSYTIKK